jgi:hypothetical protein
MGHPLNSSFAADAADDAVDPVEEVESVVIGPPSYASPDPATLGYGLHPVNRHPGDLSADYGKDQGDPDGPADTMTTTGDADETPPNPDDDLKAADWIKEIEDAKDAEALAEVSKRYDGSTHKDWPTVKTAYDKRVADFQNND